MPVIRASEIGNYLYCRRAWWYRKQGYESANQAELSTGSQIHRQHGRQVLLSGLLRTAAVFLVLAALVLAVVQLIMRIG